MLRALAFLAMLLPGVAAAQCNSSTPLPINTVLARLGVAPGPCQAIPFATLMTNIGAARTLNTTAPLAGGGTLAADRTLSLLIGVGLTTSGGNLILANPSASTLGGIESITCAANNWLSTISIAGVPACTQPAFSNISGQWTLTQGPTLGANTVLGSVGGGTPIALTQAQHTAMLNLATASLQGALPAWPNNTTTFFRGDGTYATHNFASLGGQSTFAQFPTGGATDTIIGYWASTVASALAINNCANALTYSTSTHTFGCNVGAGTGTVTTAGTGLSLTGGGTTLNLALTNATLQATPANPGTTVSGSAVMAGFGVSTCRIAPVYGTRLKFEIMGYASESVAGDVTVTQLRFGTGAGPANGAAATGTQLGAALQGTSATANAQVPFMMSGIATGLTPGTTYWFDLGFDTNGGTSTLASLTCMAMEF